MYTQLKSSVIYHDSPVIFLTLNPEERDSPMTLRFAEEDINSCKFFSERYSQIKRLQSCFSNSVTVVEYFHHIVNVIIEKILKDELFDELAHHYNIIKYQGRETSHIHILIIFFLFNIY